MKNHLALIAITALAGVVAAPAWAGPATGYAVFAGGDRNPGTTPLLTYGNSLEAYDQLAATGAISVEGFGSLATGTSTAVISFGSGDSLVKATLSGGGGKVGQDQGAGEPFNGRYSVGPSALPKDNKFWGVEASSQPTTFELSFDRKVKTFGFFGVDVGDFDGTVILDFLNGGGGTMFSINLEDALGGGLPGAGSVLYFGLNIEESRPDWFFEGVRFRTAVSSRLPVSSASGPVNRLDTFAFDSFTIVAAPRAGTPVPTPGTAALLALALAGLALTRRRA